MFVVKHLTLILYFSRYAIIFIIEKGNYAVFSIFKFKIENKKKIIHCTSRIRTSNFLLAMQPLYPHSYAVIAKSTFLFKNYYSSMYIDLLS